MTMPAGQTIPEWHVTGVTSGQYQTDAAGNAVPGHVVHFAFADGTASQVFIPDTQWNLGGAQPVIEQAVSRTAAIRYLSGGSS